MKILQLCKKFPYPLDCGEAIAVTYLSKAMKDLGCEITLLAMNTTKHYVNTDTLPESFDHYNDIQTVLIDNKIKPIAALKNLFSSDSFHIERFHSDEYAQKLKTILTENTFDIIQLETLYLTPYLDLIREYSDGLIVMRAHNIEHEIWDRISGNTRFLPKKLYLSYLSKKLKKFELDKLNDYDFLVPISEKDLEKFRHLGYKNGAKTIPIGLKFGDYKSLDSYDKPDLTLSYIGSFDWIPNKEGIVWFLENIWPELNKKYPFIKLHVAGRDMPEWFSKYATKNVILEGDVENARDFMSKHTAMIVPLLSGSGTRVKILEGMALGRTIITTSLGLEGIPAKHMQEVMIADKVDDYIECIELLISDRDKVLNMRLMAREFIKKNYNHTEQAKTLLHAYHDYIEKHR